MYTTIFAVLFPFAGFVVGAYFSLDLVRMLVSFVYPEQEGENE